MRPFGCPVTILNTLDPLGNFDGKADEGFLVGYSVSSKAFRVFNNRTKIVQETLHINFLENQPNVAGSGPTWLFNIDTVTQSMNYQPVVAGNQPNSSAGIQEHFDAVKAGEGNVQQYVLFPLWSTSSKDPQNTDSDATFEVKERESTVHVSPSSSAKTKKHDDKTKREAKGKSHAELSTGVRNLSEEFEDFSSNSTNWVNAASTPVTAIEPNSTNSTNTSTTVGPYNNPVNITYLDDEENVGVEADFSNLETTITVSPIPTSRVHKDHLVTQIIRDLSSAPQTRRIEDPDYPDKVYKVVKALYGLHQAPRAWCETLANYLLENGFQRGKIDQTLFIKRKKMSSMGELTFFLGLQVKQKEDRIFISQDKYVAEILRKFGLTDGKLASTPNDTEKPLLKDPDGEDVDVHTYRSMIGSLMYLTSSRPDIMFAICACAHFPVTLKASHLHAVKRIFRYLKGKPHLGLWYPKDSPFNLVTVVATSSTEAEYLAAASCCAQVLSIQNQLLDYGVIINVVSSKLMLFGMTIDVVHLMLLGHKQVQDDVADATEDENAVNEISAEPTLPSPTPTTIPPLQQELIPLPLQVESTLPPSLHQSPIAQPSSPPPQQPSQPEDISHSAMALLNQLLETCATLTKKVGTLEHDKIAQAIEITKLKQRGRLPESQVHVYHLDLEHAQKVLSMQETNEADPAEVEEVIEVVTAAKLMIKVVTTAAATTVTVAPVPKASAPRKRRGVIIQDPEEVATASEFVQLEDEAFARELEAELNANINWNDVIEQVNKKGRQDNTVMRYQSLKRKPVTEAQERKNMMVYLKKWLDSRWTSSKKGEKEIEEEESKRKSENLEQKAAKKQKIDEETKELKTHLQIVPNDEDDVYTETTSLALKVPVVDYQIHTKYNKPYYQLFLSFISLLRNFNREDLEMLWKIIQEIFESSEPKNFSDDFLLNALKTMFENPNVEANI
uniref:Uncharacterized protein n=1 Tax=Tanacetum cinerariifolium TaxID=118510 RepID=A0A6L2NPN4_TANCI|nr:hypothetical protein [Tanacetum cinerariifolium]